MSGIFSGLKVIDAASFLAGPCAATILSDFGADVIKIEPPSGDRHRTIAGDHHINFAWLLTSRNKRSLTLDITSDEGAGVLMRLLEDADVLVVNFNERQMQRFNLTWDRLHAHNPRLIYAQICAYGLEGPDADRRAFDVTAWFSRTGILDMMREKDAAPTPPAGGVGDHATAMTLYAGIVTALYKRNTTGFGSMVTTSLVASGVWANGINLQSTMAGIDHSEWRDNEDWTDPFFNVYSTADKRYILLALQNPTRDWPKFADLLEHPEWLEDERFINDIAVYDNGAAAHEIIAASFRGFTTEQISLRLNEAGIVYSVVAKNEEVLVDQQLIRNGVFVPSGIDQPGCERTLATPFNLSGEVQVPAKPAPELGEHSEEILREAGLTPDEIESLCGT